jgi:glycosyltransferase involved in cell wall biosynthesis
LNKIDGNPKIALAHDSFTQLGGAERVVDVLHEMFPDAPVFTLVLGKKLRDKYQAWDIRTSWLQVLYKFIPKFQYLLPFIPLAVSSLDFSGYDIVLSSSSGFIKNIQIPKNTIHINYCHTPTRFLWINANYVNQEVPAILRPLVKLMLGFMRKWDLRGAKRVNYFIANSLEVQNRILSVYQRTSTLMHAGVDTLFWHPTIPKSNYFLLAGRLQAHKNNELIIEIFNELGLPLHVVGTGRQENYLRSIAKSNAVFLGKVNDSKLRDEYSGAKGFIYPQVEDFGLMPLEAAACGTATLAYLKGGSLETIIPGKTGELFEGYDTEKIKEIILNWKPEKYQANELRRQAEKFSKEQFKKRILDFIYNLHENSN